MDLSKEETANGQCRLTGERKEPEVDWVPLSVREARRARSMRDDAWPYLWMNFASILILSAALAILAYRMALQS